MRVRVPLCWQTNFKQEIMARTPGSGWGNGKGNDWLFCPKCSKKKMLMWVVYTSPTLRGYKCHYCKSTFDGNMTDTTDTYQ